MKSNDNFNFPPGWIKYYVILWLYYGYVMLLCVQDWQGALSSVDSARRRQLPSKQLPGFWPVFQVLATVSGSNPRRDRGTCRPGRRFFSSSESTLVKICQWLSHGLRVHAQHAQQETVAYVIPCPTFPPFDITGAPHPFGKTGILPDQKLATKQKEEEEVRNEEKKKKKRRRRKKEEQSVWYVYCPDFTPTPVWQIFARQIIPITGSRDVSG